MTTALVKQLAGKDLEVAQTPAGIYVRLLRKADKVCVAWAVFQMRSGGVRLYLQTPIAEAPKALLKHVTTNGRKPCLNVLPPAEDGAPAPASAAANAADVEQARGLLLWMNEHAPAKGKKLAKPRGGPARKARAKAEPAQTAGAEEAGA